MIADRRTLATLFAWNDILLGVVICAFVFLFLVAPPKKVVADPEKPAGSISVYVFWADDQNLDIDIHARGPDNDHIFFAHKDGKNCQLLKDDLGITNDIGGRNFENLFCRSLEPGDYVFNVAAYRGTSDMYPATVDVEIRVAGADGGGLTTPRVITRRIVLEGTADEATAARFTVDANNRLVESSISSMPVPLARRKL